MQNIAFFVGAIIPTLALTSGYLWLMKSWNKWQPKLILACTFSWISAAFLYGIGGADGGAFAGLVGLKMYAAPQLLWLLAGAFWLHRKERSIG